MRKSITGHLSEFAALKRALKVLTPEPDFVHYYSRKRIKIGLQGISLVGYRRRNPA